MDIKALFPWFQKHDANEAILGLDIGSSEIKLLQIDQAALRIDYFALIPVPSGIVEKDTIKDPAALADALKPVLRKLNIPTKSVAIAIPRSSVIVKNTTVDARLSPRELESRAWMEAGQQFPDLIGEINLDYLIIGPSPDDDTKLDLVLIACRKEQIKPYLDFINEAGLIPKIVDVNSYALERALALEAPQETDTVALLNMDYALTSLVVVKAGNQIFSHDYSFDGRGLINNLANAEGLEKEAIDVMLKQQLSTHLRHVIHFFYSSRHNIAIKKIYLSGDLALHPAIAPFIQAEIGIETVVALPCGDMALGPNVDSALLKEKDPALALSCGLAISKLRLL